MFVVCCAVKPQLSGANVESVGTAHGMDEETVISVCVLLTGFFSNLIWF